MSSTRSAGAIGSVSRKRAQIERTLASYSSANWVHWSPSSPSQAFAISTLAIGSLMGLRHLSIPSESLGPWARTSSPCAPAGSVAVVDDVEVDELHRPL